MTTILRAFASSRATQPTNPASFPTNRLVHGDPWGAGGGRRHSEITFNGATWTTLMTFGSTGFLGLAGVVNGSKVWLIAGTADGNGSKNPMVFVDSGSGTPVSMPAGQVDGATRAFRGISLPPNCRAGP